MDYSHTRMGTLRFGGQFKGERSACSLRVSDKVIVQL